MLTSAEQVLAQNSKSFALAGKLLPKACRHDAAVLYAWCRRADDAIDQGDPSTAGLRLADLRQELALVYAGEVPGDPNLLEFQRLIRARSIPREYPEALLDGFETDLGAVRLRTLSELLLYAQRVAGVVGLMMCHVLGISRADAKRNAADLGIAMQLTNICRDVAEDWERGRLYLPEELLLAAGVQGLVPGSGRSLLPLRAPLSQVVERLLVLADARYRSGDAGLDALPLRAGIAVRAARLVYAEIGRELSHRNYDVLGGRAVVSRRRKLWLVLRAGVEELVSRVGRRSAPQRSPSQFSIYVGRIREFTREDWWVYCGWVGLMLGLVFATGGFIGIGHWHGVRYPAEAYLLPVGAAIFALSIGIDTIGHRTVYKEEISRAEGLVHGITIFCGITSCVLLCLAYQARALLWVPALVLTGLSFLYSLIDEAFHWRRYAAQRSDPVEMWSHVGIFVGHSILMLSWWSWFFQGYHGVADTLRFISTS